MTKKEKIQAILLDKRLRVPFLKRDLYRFGRFYFPHLFPSKSPQFHKDWAKAYQGKKNVLNIGFRGSAKTTWLTVKYAHAIAYRTSRFVTHYCSEWSKSEAFLFDLVVQLQTNERFIKDFGMLFPGSHSRSGKKEKSGVSEFITTNEIRVKAMSIGQSPRGLVYQASDGSYRPDLVGLDDIDTLRTVSNSKMVDKHFSFVNNEIIGGLQNGSKIIFLGNVIKFDGVVPRFEKAHSQNPDWIVFRQAVKNPDGTVAWPERYCETDEEAEETGKISLEAKRRAEGSTSYAQNYLLVPASDGDTVIRREVIKYGSAKEWKTLVIGVDPAFSSSSLSDAFAISVVAHGDGFRNVRASYALQGKAKEYSSAVDFVAKLYKETGANVVHFEAVAGQTVLAQMLRSKGVATKEVRPHSDKVTRLMEYQSDIEAGKITFDRDGHGIPELVEEMVEMPNGLHDDRTDAMMYALMPFKKFDVYIG